MAKDTEKWGRDEAKSRYGTQKEGLSNMKENILDQPREPMDRQGDNYDNDASGWVRGPDGTKKPGFDRS